MKVKEEVSLYIYSKIWTMTAIIIIDIIDIF